MRRGVARLMKLSRLEISIFLLLFSSASLREYIDSSSNSFFRPTEMQAFSNSSIRLSEPKAIRSALCCSSVSLLPFSFASLKLRSYAFQYSPNFICEYSL